MPEDEADSPEVEEREAVAEGNEELEADEALEAALMVRGFETAKMPSTLRGNEIHKRSTYTIRTACLMVPRRSPIVV